MLYFLPNNRRYRENMPTADPETAETKIGYAVRFISGIKNTPVMKSLSSS